MFAVNGNQFSMISVNDKRGLNNINADNPGADQLFFNHLGKVILLNVSLSDVSSYLGSDRLVFPFH